MKKHRASKSVIVLQNSQSKFLKHAVAASIAAMTFFILLSSVFVPLFAMLGWYQVANAINYPISIICHQLPSRCLSLFGVQIAICSRCFAFYLSMFLCSIAYWCVGLPISPISTRMLLVLVTPLALDATTQLFGFRTSTNFLRAVTGFVAGVGVCLSILPSLTNKWIRFIYSKREVLVLKKFFPSLSAICFVCMIFFVLLATTDIVNSDQRAYDEAEAIRRSAERLMEIDRAQKEAARRRADEKEYSSSDNSTSVLCCVGLIVAIVIGLASGSKKMKADQATKVRIAEQNQSQKASTAERLAKAKSLGFSFENATKECPACAEAIKLKATICRYCRKEFSVDEVEQAVKHKVDIFLSGRKLDRVDELIDKTVEDIKSGPEQQTSPPIRPFDSSMPQMEYEQYCLDLLRGLGWTTHLTEASGDRGIDILAEKGGQKFFIQCMKCSIPVGDKAVQEVIATMKIKDAYFAAIVSDNKFTPSAYELAKKNGVLLLHHSELDRLDELFNWCKP